MTLCLSCSRSARVEGRSYPARRNGRIVKCEQCGADVYQTPSDQALGRKRFCGKDCQVAWNRAQPRLWVGQVDNSGRRNGMFRHGRRSGEHKTKPAVRAEVAARDGDWCLMCGRPPPGLHLHRVVYGSQGGQYEVANCVQLCGLDHELVHSDKRVWKPLLDAYLRSPSEATRRALAERARQLPLWPAERRWLSETTPEEP